MDLILVAIDFVGTFVFAISGATVGVRHRLDLFGVLVLAFAAAVSGGIVRDVLIGATPPTALASWHYLGVSCLAGVITFYRCEDIEKLRNPVQIFDALGLALFAATGASKALAFGLTPASAILLGMLSGIGGGIVRDMLVAQTPVVLRSELYAVAALAGASVIVAGKVFAMPDLPVLIVAVTICFGLRFMAIRFGWRLPVAPSRSD
ncbi:MAG: trimeric intracellular cation channel family protein [Dokdonella sp.]|nr:trimeric intracellular cation channel family protein [Dokdonella sp.]MCB1571461.1 trimeric intracellular cation channel family protein [Xanthomonadales bacterium]MCB1572841.1 trimeric intracellular cation channel family protein [Xanthomonadales bacterium]MCB1575790.1 trimeric intracellular cation channel family protein [Xanthomonadales bacterium]